MNSGFPIRTEIIYLLKKLKAKNVNKTKDGKKQDVYPERFVGQGETGSRNGLPHFISFIKPLGLLQVNQNRSNLNYSKF